MRGDEDAGSAIGLAVLLLAVLAAVTALLLASAPASAGVRVGSGGCLAADGPSDGRVLFGLVCEAR